MVTDLKPRSGTAITGEGRVVFRDVTGYELQRMCVEVRDKYPDVETWLALLADREYKIIRIRYTERMKETGFFGYLWFYWKEG